MDYDLGQILADGRNSVIFKILKSSSNSSLNFSCIQNQGQIQIQIQVYNQIQI